MLNPTEVATVEQHPLNDEDRQLAALAGEKFRGMQSLALILAVGFALGGWYMAQRGHNGDAVAGGVACVIMVACVIGLGRAKTRDASLATKDVITGVIHRRRQFETRYNLLHYFDVGGIEVAVPPAVYDRFQEGQGVRVERLTGSRQFLRIESVSPPASDAVPNN